MLFTSGFDIICQVRQSVCLSESFPIIIVFSASEGEVWNLGTERNHVFRTPLQNLTYSFLLRAILSGKPSGRS